MNRFLAVSAEGARSVTAGETFMLRVSGTSMLPVLREGDVIEATRLASGATPCLGDLVVLDLPGAGLVVHRLLWWGAKEARTRGDGSGRMDTPVAHANVLGRVDRVTRDGSDATPGGLALRLAWMRGFAVAAWFRLGRRLHRAALPA